MRIEVAGISHVGMKRNHNEDNWFPKDEDLAQDGLNRDLMLFCVADGMGGHSSGEVASKIALDELAEFFRMTSKDQDATWPYKMDRARNYDENRLATGIKLANMRIHEQSSADPKLRGMGTTIVSVFFSGTTAYVGHVGDSRVYRFSRGELKQVTEDHSLLNDYLKSKKLTPEEIEAFPHKNVIVRALGMKDSVQVDVVRVEPLDGDIFLLCSDGLSGMVPDALIRDTLSRAPDLKKASEQLIDLANANGGLDNVTCVLAQYFNN
jgi:serine/threonine protein phosphatase PrpC